MHFLFLVLQSFPSSRPCSPRPRLGTSLSLSSMVRFIFLEIVVPSLIDFLRMLSASHPLPSLLRSRNDFLHVCGCENCFVRYCLAKLVLVDDHALLSPGSPQGRLLDLQLSCSEFLFISFGLSARTFRVLSLLATLLAHVCAMRLAFRLHAVCSSALVSSAA